MATSWSPSRPKVTLYMAPCANCPESTVVGLQGLYASHTKSASAITCGSELHGPKAGARIGCLHGYQSGMKRMGCRCCVQNATTVHVDWGKCIGGTLIGASLRSPTRHAASLTHASTAVGAPWAAIFFQSLPLRCSSPAPWPTCRHPAGTCQVAAV
jgi:hypothetical protein